MSSEYRVNKTTGQVVKDDGTGWKPVASVRNKTTGEILIDEGNGWQPMPGAQRTLQADRGMTMASERANQAMASGQRIAPDDLTQLGRPDFSSAAMARLPAPTMSVADMDAFEAQRAAEKERLRVPDSDFKERSIIALNVPTVGFGPQAAAGAKTLGALAATPFIEDDIIDREGVSGAMSSFLDEARVHQRRAREERPLESFGIEIGGGLFQGKTFIDNFGRRMFPKTNTASNLGRVVGTGTGYGLAYGFGQSESDTLQGALGDAAYGGALGAGFGLGFKAAEPALTAGYRSAKTGAATISDALSDLLGKAGGARDKVAQEVALAAVRRSMERSGMTFDQIMELVKRYEGKPAVLAEVIGQDAVNSLTALTRRPGSTPQKAQDLIEERFYGRPDRMKGDVEDATGIPIGQLDETLDAQLIERQRAAKPIYDALYKQYSTIKSFGESLKRINRLARTPAMQKHLKLAEEAVRTQAAIRQVPLSKMSKMEYWDLVKRSLDDEINSAVAKGEARTKVGASVAELTQLKSAITDEFDRLTGGAYAAAREAGGEALRLRAAAAAGQKALQARNPREVAKTVAATLSQDLPALRAGIVDDLGTRIDKGMTPGRVRVPDVAGKLRAGLGDESANKLINRLDAEATLSETGSRWAPRMNSVTGTVMESGATQMGDDLINAGMNLATGNKVGLVRQAINFMRQRGFSQRQIDAIGDLLLSSPEKGLRRLKMMAPDGAPTNALAPVTGAADDAFTPPPAGGTQPANALAPKPGKLGTRTADAAAIATLGLQGGTAEADTGGVSAELKTANERVTVANKTVADTRVRITTLQSQLDMLQDPAGDIAAKQSILKLRGRYLGTTGPKGDGVDGVDGDNTTAAINDEAAKIEAAIIREQASLEKAQIEETKALEAAKQVRMQKIQADAQPGKGTELAREFGPYGGVAAGIAAAYLMRRGAGQKFYKASQSAADSANALLTDAPINVRAGVQHPNGINVRATNLNAFARQGKAPSGTTPFDDKQTGSFRARAKKDTVDPSDLFPEPGFMSSRLRIPDYGWSATGLIEAQVAGGLRAKEEKKIADYEADVERFAAAGDEAGLQRASASLQQAKNMYAIASAFERAGYAYAATRMVAGLKDPYKFVRPDIKAYEKEASSLRTAISKK